MVGKKAAGLHERPAKLKGDLGKTAFHLFRRLRRQKYFDFFVKNIRTWLKKPTLPQAGYLGGGIYVIKQFQLYRHAT
jgi:hypothetical protein